jgi:site-specific DNA recombinase
MTISVQNYKRINQAVAYCRVSTHNQKVEGTIGLQENAIIEYCQNNNFTLVKSFNDNGVSGGLENRSALSELFSYLEQNKEIKTVIIWKLDRLARNLYLQEHLIRKLEELKVTLVSAKEPNLDSTDPMRKAFRQFMGIVSELEKSFITMRLTAGRINKAKMGQYSGGRPAYGYSVKNGKVLINHKQADIVKTIYKMKRYNRMSYWQIAEKLNDRQIKSANGGNWFAGTVRYLLKNPLYKGVLSYKSIETKIPNLSILSS